MPSVLRLGSFYDYGLMENKIFHFDLVDHFEEVVTIHSTCLHGRCSRRCDCARLPLCCDGLRRSPTSLGIVRDRAPRPRHCTARWAAHRSAGSDERERMDGDDSPSPLTKRPSDGGCCPATKASTVASSMSCPWTQWPTFGRTSSRGGRSSARWNRRFRTRPSSLPRWTR